MKIILNKRTADKLKLRYGSLERYANIFLRSGFEFVNIKVWGAK